MNVTKQLWVLTHSLRILQLKYVKNFYSKRNIASIASNCQQINEMYDKQTIGKKITDCEPKTDFIINPFRAVAQDQ